MKQFYILLIILFSTFSSWAQVGIGTTTPNAQLDIKASNQSTPANNDGILIPKVDSFPIVNPTALQDGMMVYLTTTAGPNQPGFYYWDNATTNWKSVGGDKGWILNGNSGTTPISSYTAAPNENFIGTSDATDLSIGTNKNESIRLKSGIDKIGLFNKNPDYNLDLVTNVTGVILPRNGFRVKDIMGGSGAQKGSFFGFDHNNLNETLIWTYGNNENIFNDKSIRIGVGNETVNQTLAKFTYRSLGLFGDNPSYSLDIKTAPNDAIFHTTRRNGIRINTPFSNSNTDYAGLFLGIKENGNFQDSNEAYIWNYGDGVATNSFLSFGTGPDTTTGEIMRVFNDKIGIGTTNPTNGAILDINSTTSGILIPRVFLSNVNTGGPIFVLTESLLVYNTNAFVLGGTGTGFYYWDNTKWVKIATDTSDKWSITGNSGTNSLTNFIGTTDDNDFVFRRNNLRAGFLGNTNTSLGVNSMPNTVIGTNNVAIGNETLKLGYWNTNGTTAVGSYALSNNTTGLGNTATGFESLKNNSLGNYNTANGYQALANQFSGEGNSAFGYNSLSSGDGSFNTANGSESLRYNYGNFNTALGYHTLLQNNSGTKNTALGANSLISNFIGSSNTAIGNDALKLNTTNSGLTAIGESALANNNYGTGNTATGFESLKNNSSGNYNTANGYHSLLFQYSGEGNSAFGYETLSSGDGSFNTAIGNQALRYNIGNNNTALGYNSMVSNNWGTKNTALGAYSLISNFVGNSNTAIGNDALRLNTTSSGLTAIGESALANNNYGAGNTATGFEALKNNSSGNYNTANGYHSLTFQYYGEGNSAFGYETLSNGDGSFNTAIGNQALRYNIGNNNTALGYNSMVSNNWGTKNTAIGTYSLLSNYIGNGNTAIGNDALRLNTTSSGLTAIGESALANNNYGTGNTATGFESLKNNSNGNYNTANGYHSLLFQYSGEGNSAFGYETLSNGDGSFNTAIGNQALRYNIGNNNTALGYNSLTSNNWGTQNTALGYRSLVSNYNGSNNTAIGNDALSNSNSGSNNIGIGNNAQVTFPNSNDQLSIANVIYGADLGSISTGKIGIGNMFPSETLDIIGRIKINDGNQSSGKVLTSDAFGVGTWQSLSVTNYWTRNGVGQVYPTTISDNIGIGTNNPTYKLHIGDANSGFRVEGPSFASTGGASISAGGYGEVQIDKPGIVGGRLIVKENGNVGINNNNPTQSLDIAGKIKIADGTQGIGKVLASDINGVGSWVNNVAITPSVQGVFAGGGVTFGNGVAVGGTSPFYYTNVYIDLPVGKWMVFGTYLLNGSMSSGGSIFVRTSFSNSNITYSGSSDIISGGLISGVLAGPTDFGIANGQTVINNTSGATKRYYMWANLVKYGTCPSTFNLNSIGSSFWSENQLTAIPMN